MIALDINIVYCDHIGHYCMHSFVFWYNIDNYSILSGWIQDNSTTCAHSNDRLESFVIVSELILSMPTMALYIIGINKISPVKKV